MSRIILPDGNFAAKRRGVEPASSITTLDLWTFLKTNVAGSPNMVTNTAMTQTGTVVFGANYATTTPAVNFLTPAGPLVDVADQTIMFVARTQQAGGNYSPIVTAYPAGAGLFIGLGSNYLRIHATGFGAILNYTMSGSYGSLWSFYSIVLDSGHATPIRWKCWTANNSGTGGTASGNRASLGNTLTIAGHSIATFGTFAGDIAWVGRATSILDDTQIQSCYESAKLSLAGLGLAGV